MGQIKSPHKDTLVSVNGVLTAPEEAVVSIFDRGFLYGDSVYEVTLTYEKTPYLLETHLDRLWQSAEGIGMAIKWSREDIRRFILSGLEKFEQERVYIRIIITRGGGEIGLDPNLSDGQNLFIIFKDLPYYPQEWYDNGVSLIVTEVMRTPKKAVDPNVKSGNYLNNVMAISKAREQGAYDAVMLNSRGYVTESTSSNIWAVFGHTFITPPQEAGLLGGITRQTLLALGKKNGLDMKEENFTADTLRRAEEVFITSSTREILPVTKIDGQVIGNGSPGPKTKKLHKLYKEFVKEAVAREKRKTSSTSY